MSPLAVFTSSAVVSSASTSFTASRYPPSPSPSSSLSLTHSSSDKKLSYAAATDSKATVAISSYATATARKAIAGVVTIAAPPSSSPTTAGDPLFSSS